MLTLESGVQLEANTGTRTLNVDGLLNAENVTIDNVNINYRDGSGGTLQNSVLSGSTPITVGGTSVVGRATSSIFQNTINASSTGIDIRGTSVPTVTGNTIVTSSRGLYFRETGGGTASGNILDFVPATGNSRVAIEVDGDASLTIDNNVLMDDPFKSDTLIDLGQISAASTATITNNQVCVTGNDLAYRVDYHFFANSSTAVFSGNTATCDPISNITVQSVAGSISVDNTLTGVNGITSPLLGRARF